MDTYRLASTATVLCPTMDAGCRSLCEHGPPPNHRTRLRTASERTICFFCATAFFRTSLQVWPGSGSSQNKTFGDCTNAIVYRLGFPRFLSP